MSNVMAERELLTEKRERGREEGQDTASDEGQLPKCVHTHCTSLSLSYLNFNTGRKFCPRNVAAAAAAY